MKCETDNKSEAVKAGEKGKVLRFFLLIKKIEFGDAKNSKLSRSRNVNQMQLHEYVRL